MHHTDLIFVMFCEVDKGLPIVSTSRPTNCSEHRGGVKCFAEPSEMAPQASIDEQQLLLVIFQSFLPARQYEKTKLITYYLLPASYLPTYDSQWFMVHGCGPGRVHGAPTFRPPPSHEP